NGWSRFQGELGEFVEILPASQRVDESQWYEGTADAIYQNLDIIRTYHPEYVLVLSGDHIYKMDYGPMLGFHYERQADMTVSCLEVPVEEAAGAFGVLTVDENHRVLRFDEKPKHPTPIPGNDKLCLASMGNYVFNTQFLYDQLIKDADDPNSKHDFGHSIIPKIISEGRGLYAYPFRDPATGKQAYWRDVGTVDAFWEANLELVDISPDLNLYDEEWPILTYQAQLPPAKFVFDENERRGMAINSMISAGCVISGGQLYHSLLFSNCKVNSYAKVFDSVLLPCVEVGRNARIRRAIIDRGCQIPAGMSIGDDLEEDKKRGFRVTEKGVVLVTPDMLGQKVHVFR
nr:glucose-1-phosphate adenylyltransferase [Pseudomonadota bacterium]